MIAVFVIIKLYIMKEIQIKTSENKSVKKKKSLCDTRFDIFSYLVILNKYTKFNIKCPLL